MHLLRPQTARHGPVHLWQLGRFWLEVASVTDSNSHFHNLAVANNAQFDALSNRHEADLVDQMVIVVHPSSVDLNDDIIGLEVGRLGRRIGRDA